MQKIKRMILSALCLCTLIGAFSGTAIINVSAVQTTLPSGVIIGDQDGINVDAHGYYYIDARDLEGGDVIHKTVTIQNLSQNDRTPEGQIPYTISMTAQPLFNRGPEDLLDKTQLVLKLDGRVIYTGRVRGDGIPNMIAQALDLGTYDVGERRTLDITLTVDNDLQLYEEKSEADFKWEFYAYRASASIPPKTGLLETYWMYLLPIGGNLLLFLLLAFMKKKREQKQAVHA